MQYRITLSVILSTLFSGSVLAQTTPPATPQQADEQFNHAVLMRDEGNVDEAIKALEALLATQAQQDRVRLELAVAHFRNLDFAKARMLATEVLNKPGTPESVRVTIRQFLAQIETESKPNVFTPFVSVGYVSDSNVNAGPARSVIDIGGIQFNLNDAAQKRSDNGYTALVGLGHRYLAPGTRSIGGRNAIFLWQSQASYYKMSYNDATDLNLDVLSLNTGPMLVAANHWRLSLPYQLNEIKLGGDRLATFHGLAPTATFNVGRWELMFDPQIQVRKFHRAGDEGRNSMYRAAGATVGRSFDSDKYAIAATARAFDENADVDRFTNKGTEYSAQLTVRPLQGLELFARGSYRDSKYDGLEPVYAFARHDKETRYNLGASYTVRSGALAKWTASLVATDVRNDSNASIYEYERKQIGLNLGRSF
jgi:hypothetical protein